MQAEIKENVRNWEDDDEVAAYLAKIVNKQAYDGTGLVYGMGHAVYTLSDPRAIIGKRFAEQLAAGTEYEAELNLLKSIERLTPEVFAREKGSTKALCANVDMYSGFIYAMMGIPEDLFTPRPTASRKSPPASASSAPPTRTPSAAPSPTSPSRSGREEPSPWEVVRGSGIGPGKLSRESCVTWKVASTAAFFALRGVASALIDGKRRCDRTY